MQAGFDALNGIVSWWPRRSSRNAKPQTPPGPEGSNGSGGRVCRDVAVGAASISGYAIDLKGFFRHWIRQKHNPVIQNAW